MNNINQKIPEGWNIVFLNSLSSKGIMNGIFNNPTKVGKGVPLINVVDLYNDKIDINRLSLLDVSEDELKRYEVITGDLLFTRSSLKLEGIAQCNIVPTKNSRCVFDCHIIRIRPNDQLVVPYYLFAYCNTAIAKIQFMKLSKTTTMTTIDQDGLGQLKVLLPPLAEQEKIAEILGTWDEAIKKLSSLIEQKKNLKKGLMQKLLTGKTRLKDFPQPWKEVKLGNLCTMFSGGTPSVLEEDYYKNGDIPFIRSGEISSSETALFITEKGLKNSSAKMIEKGDLLYALYGATSGETAISKINGAINQAILCIRSTKIEILYLYYVLLNNKSIILSKYLQGGQGNLSADIVKKLSIKMPSDIAEQKAIADVLSTADEEIDLLNKKLEALKEQKKGLMQQLLTGQTRVKVN